MIRFSLLRWAFITLVMVPGLLGAMGPAEAPAAPGYPNGRFLVTAQWLNAHLDDMNLVIVDVREKKHLNQAFIPGALHMEWRWFQEADPRGAGVFFVGVERAQQLLGGSGIRRTDRVVLYDSEKRDGAAIASYVFWVLDLLGHPEVMVLERGIEAWTDAGLETVSTHRASEAVLYQAPPAEQRLERWVGGDLIHSRLGDPRYQILDVRSADEYLGRAPTPGLDGRPLRSGHIPTAYNIDYTLNWSDPARKTIKPYGDLQQLYAGLDRNREVVVYCLSGRRASFSYLILRTMGFEKVALYDGSWFEWGHPGGAYPVETRPNALR